MKRAASLQKKKKMDTDREISYFVGGRGCKGSWVCNSSKPLKAQCKCEGKKIKMANKTNLRPEAMLIRNDNDHCVYNYAGVGARASGCNSTLLANGEWMMA